ncbi:M20 family metallopeptidase [Lysinibacillus fusiformis]|uniref:M20 family metallopeptidase n=1 Tax=Lysinibacillus fusiformis TaxID=28031 RepID=UPI00124632EA|nr:M20 family metallopeptidase [Lysinibacillus fusiformis]KAB0441671.1 amidohydrolase [Lysinibacillus fusiformis]MCE4043490.1 M20 family metallopeptidase [Lysinibacillus fusiformis]MDC6268881.1 M20 family metallopeptidase [Lysinibacillus sphaericus]MDN4969674.1 M20 family metallopeptidase [Lysinibacillus fusiformis]
MTSQSRLSQIIEDKREKLIEVSNQIWEYAETGFEEFKSAKLLCQTLAEEGFEVEQGVANIETAFIGSFGSGKPVIAFLGEFDALTGLSQNGGIAQPNPQQIGGNGHGCGHNLLGTGSLAAAIALRDYMQENNITGTVRYYGCPGEEIGGGKTFMAREGIFNDVDIALSWHPGTTNNIMSVATLACYEVYFKFKGKSAHAAASPHLGRSALDAVELMNIGVNYLREHIIPEARVHYAITNTGGFSPNVVQAEAEVLYFVRAPRVSQTDDIYQRICDIARGAALMTGTEVDIDLASALSNVIPNTTLEQVMYDNFVKLGTPSYTDAELHFAEAIRETLSEEEKKMDVQRNQKLAGKAIADVIDPFMSDAFMAGSTDVGDVSWIVPTAQCMTACEPLGTPLHTWQIVATGTTSLAHKGMLHAGKILAATALDILQQPELIEQAQAELVDRRAGEVYTSPLPSDVKQYKIRS